MISCLAAPGAQTVVKPPAGRSTFEPCCCWSFAESQDPPLKVVDLTRVEIDQPQPLTPATRRLGWPQGTDVRRIVLLPSASVDLGRISGVENDKLIWPHCAGLIWPHPWGRFRCGRLLSWLVCWRA